MINNPSDYLQNWTYMSNMIAYTLMFLSCANYLFYLIVVTLISNRSKKYHFVLKNENLTMFISSIGFSIAIALIFNTFLLSERDFSSMLVFSIKAGLSIGIGITIAFALRVYLNTYYQFVLEKRLADIRFRERLHPDSARPMRLLNEEEEDEYLTDEMIRQEDELSFDFDVWIDDMTKKTIIETYKGSTNKICGQCNFRSLKLVNEEIDVETIQKTKIYKCSHCGHVVKDQDQW